MNPSLLYLCNSLIIINIKKSSPLQLEVKLLFFLLCLPAQILSTPLRFPSNTAQNFFQLSPNGSYLFFYDTGPGNHQSFREEKRSVGGTISGSYGYVDPLGSLHITEYVADSKGYRASLEIFKPIHKNPDGPALIIGPLPADFRSFEEKQRQKSVFDKYKFPIKSFESLKILSTIPTYYTNDFHDKNNDIIEDINKMKENIENNEIFDNDIETENFPPNVVDITVLKKQLKSLADFLKQNPVLIIGPLPTLLPDIKSVSSFENNSMDSSRLLRSLFKDKSNSSESLTNVFRSLNYKVTKYSKPTLSLTVPPQAVNLNYEKKNIMSNREHTERFSEYPSSGLLQGKFLPSSLTKDNNLFQKSNKVQRDSRLNKRFFKKLNIS